MRCSSGRAIYRIISEHRCCCCSSDREICTIMDDLLMDRMWLGPSFTAHNCCGAVGVMEWVRVEAKMKWAGRAASGYESYELGNPLGRDSEGIPALLWWSPELAPFRRHRQPDNPPKLLGGSLLYFSLPSFCSPLDGLSIVLHRCSQALTQNHCRKIKHRLTVSDLPLHFFFKSGVREISLVTPLNLALYSVIPFTCFPISLLYTISRCNAHTIKLPNVRLPIRFPSPMSIVSQVA